MSLWNAMVSGDFQQFEHLSKLDGIREEIRRLAINQSIGESAPDLELSRSIAALVQSQARVVDSIADVRLDLENGFAGLGALFEWRMTTVISLLEQQQSALLTLQDLLRYPRRTQANEDKESAREAWQLALKTTTPGDPANIRWLGRAKEFFEAAAKNNPFDYTVHFDAGLLLLSSHSQPEQALPHFHEAIRTAQAANDLLYEGKGHFCAARCHELCGRLEDAYSEGRIACDRSTNEPVYMFELARYCALTGRVEACDRLVEGLLRTAAIGGGRTRHDAQAWWAKIEADKDFAAVRHALEA